MANLVYADSILQANNVYAGSSATFDLKYGGQQGFMPNIGMMGPDGKLYGEWISNHAYVKRNIIPVLLQAPRFFDFMPDGNRFISAWKALLEKHPLTIDGLSSGLKVDSDEHPIGGAGEMQEEVTNVTRERSTPSFTFQEKAGRAIQKLLGIIIRYGMMDPDTKKPLVANYFKSNNDYRSLYTPDFYTSTMLFIEPDITHRHAQNAWLCSNMFPKSDGDNTGKMDKKAGGELLSLSIEFSAITQNTDTVHRFADAVLRSMTILNKLPDIHMTLPMNDIDSKVKAQKDSGYNSR